MHQRFLCTKMIQKMTWRRLTWGARNPKSQRSDMFYYIENTKPYYITESSTTKWSRRTYGGLYPKCGARSSNPPKTNLQVLLCTLTKTPWNLLSDAKQSNFFLVQPHATKKHIRNSVLMKKVRHYCTNDRCRYFGELYATPWTWK